MRELWSQHAQWFKTLFEVFAPQRYHANFERYVAHMQRNGVWASFLERDVAANLFNCNVLMHTPGSRTPGFESVAAHIREDANHNIADNFVMYCAYVNAGNFSRPHAHNHFISLRPMERNLMIHQVQPARVARAQIAMLKQTALPRFNTLLTHELNQIMDAPNTLNEQRDAPLIYLKRRRLNGGQNASRNVLIELKSPHLQLEYQTHQARLSKQDRVCCIVAT